MTKDETSLFLGPGGSYTSEVIRKLFLCFSSEVVLASSSKLAGGIHQSSGDRKRKENRAKVSQGFNNISN